MYKRGGWIAKAGSCKIGLNPKPFVCPSILRNGFDVNAVNKMKPIIINAWVSKIFKTKE